jgi:hypothetical protein
MTPPQSLRPRPEPAHIPRLPFSFSVRQVYIVSLIAGSFLIAYTLRDIFHTVFHPVGTGNIGDQVGKITWKAFRAVARRKWHNVLAIAGPLAMIIVVLCWTILLSIGFAFVYLPYIGTNFVRFHELQSQPLFAFWDSFSLSFTALVTLGSPNTLPSSRVMQLLLPFEALLGFGLFTAAISWVLSTYPVLRRRQGLANALHVMVDTEQRYSVRLLDSPPDYVNNELAALAADVIEIRTDLLQFPITLYFHALEDRDNLAIVLPFLHRLADDATAIPEFRHPAHLLDLALRDLANTLADHYLGQDAKNDIDEILLRLQKDHLSLRPPYPQPTKKAA